MGADADVVVLHPGSLEVQYVIANGKLMNSPETPSAGMLLKPSVAVTEL